MCKYLGTQICYMLADKIALLFWGVRGLIRSGDTIHQNQNVPGAPIIVYSTRGIIMSGPSLGSFQTLTNFRSVTILHSGEFNEPCRLWGSPISTCCSPSIF